MARIASHSAVLVAALLAISPTAGATQAFETQMTGWFANIQRSISAFRVDTRQGSLGSEQSSNSGHSAALGFANVVAEQEAAIQARDAIGRYESMHNSETTGLCTTTDTQQTANAAGDAVTNLNEELGDFEKRWLERGGDRSKTLVATHRMRRTAFCTESERERGLCEGSPAFGIPPAGDSDAGPFLFRRSYGSAEVDVGTVYTDTVAPFPTIAASEDATSVSELVQRAEARRDLALIALARAGLTDVLVRGVQGGIVE